MTGAAGRWFNIPANRPFLDDLAQGVHAQLTPEGPDALAAATILVPNRRAVRALAQAFTDAAGGRALLLPQIRALGDLNEGEPPFEPGDLALDLPPAIDPWRRRFELAALAAAHGPTLGRTLDAAGALELGDALGAFFDSLEIEEVRDLGRIADLAPQDLAEHWQISADFLRIAVDAWPERLAALGFVDVSTRRVALLNRLAESWTQRPPQGVVIAAGSTGSAGATARLLAVVAGLPRGVVVLPGLDVDLADTAWADVDDQHPQGAMKRLLEIAEITRRDVTPWRAAVDMQGRWRRRILNEALRPAEATADWRKQIAKLRDEAPAGEDPIAEGLKGLSLVSTHTEDDAAAVITVLLREVLETPGRTCAVVTPDQALARRISARLARWDIAVDASAGAPLADCAVGVLITLAARLCRDRSDPVTLLAILKHPLVRLGLAPDDLARAATALEVHGLRGPRYAEKAALDAKLAKAEGRAVAALDLVHRLDLVFAPVCALLADGAANVTAATRALTTALEALAADAAGDTGGLWAGAGGEAAAGLLAALIDDGEALPPVTARAFVSLVDHLLSGETVRTPGAVHARIQILGALEGRLISADRLILAGLEEGVWPPNAPTDPFLSRQMRTALGLPSPERRIGLSAHDFAQAACAAEVVLVHSERRGGQPSVKSRWLWRLETLARGAELAIPGRPELAAWTHSLDAPAAVTPARRPEPRPPVERRPRIMAVTRIEALTRDPYAVWARDILKLFPLERPDEIADARTRGTAIHAAFERFSLQWPRDLPPDAADQFQTFYLDALVAAGLPRASMAREKALACEAALWIEDLERQRRADGAVIVVETFGALSFPAPGGPFRLTARTDRIELTRGGLGHILDYKTGKAPSKKMVETGFSPQLTLTAAILAYGDIEGVDKAVMPGDLGYIEVTGRKPAGKLEIRSIAEDTLAAAERALSGLQRLIARYDDPAQPYRSRTAPQFVKTYAGDYDHLARVFEWATSGEDDE